MQYRSLRATIQFFHIVFLLASTRFLFTSNYSSGLRRPQVSALTCFTGWPERSSRAFTRWMGHRLNYGRPLHRARGLAKLNANADETA